MTSRLLAIAALFLALLAVAETAPIAAQSPPPCPTRSATPASDPRLTQDCNTLLELKATLEGTATLDWARNTDPLNDWEGVFADATNGVTVLNLGYYQLTGSIPAALGNLTNLTQLNLSDNQLTGKIPDLSTLTSLQYLHLFQNELTGSIPATLGTLTSLQQLDLNSNQLTGKIPDLSTLTSLTQLNLYNNQLTGSIPATLGTLTSLTLLNLYNNRLTAPIPTALGTLTNLTDLYLHQNKLTGQIPDLSTLTSLTRLHLYQNQLTGEIPDLSSLTMLRELYLHENQLTGEIPDLSTLASLRDLRLSNNRLTGEIPDELGTLINLSFLYLDNNRLTGPIPPALGNIRITAQGYSLLWLYLNHNRLTGSVPEELGQLVELQRLYLACNPQLKGTLPSAIFTMTSLRQVALYGTALTLPAGLSETDRQKVLPEEACSSPTRRPVTTPTAPPMAPPTDDTPSDDDSSADDGSTRRACPPLVPPLLPIIGQTAAATAYALPGERALLHLHASAQASVVLGLGWIAADGASRVPVDFVRDADRGHTYAVVRREADGLIVRHWLAPSDPLIYAVPWDRVNTEYTFPAAVLAAIPLDDRHAAPNQLARHFDGTDPRVLAFDATRGQWWHVSHPALFQALGFSWNDVTAADADFVPRLAPERAAPFPRIIGRNATATAYEVPADRLVLHRHDIPAPAIVINIGRIAADGATLAPLGFVRDADLGQTYAVVRREADDLIVRRWIAPDSPLVPAIPWDRVTTQYTLPAAVLATIPLDERHAAPNQLARRFAGAVPQPLPPPPLAPEPVVDDACPPPPPPLPRLIEQTATATVYELPGERALLHLHASAAASAVLSIGWIAADGAARVPVGFVRDDAIGHTYAVVRREADGLIVRHWLAPADPVIYTVPWDRVTTQYTFPVTALTAIPLDDRHAAPNQLARRSHGTDDRVFAYDAALGQWRHIPDLATFQALGFYWCDVTTADAAFLDRITLGPPYPASSVPPRPDYPSCRP